MEVIFSSISGLGDKIDVPLRILNKSSNKFFFKKEYSDHIQRIMLILVTKNLNEDEKMIFKAKYTANGNAVAINFYLDNAPFINENLQAIVYYISEVIINTLIKNKRLRSINIDCIEFQKDLANFFVSI